MERALCACFRRQEADVEKSLEQVNQDKMEKLMLAKGEETGVSYRVLRNRKGC